MYLEIGEYILKRFQNENISKNMHILVHRINKPDLLMQSLDLFEVACSLVVVLG
jgi:hypothetical protein